MGFGGQGGPLQGYGQVEVGGGARGVEAASERRKCKEGKGCTAWVDAGELGAGGGDCSWKGLGEGG